VKRIGEERLFNKEFLALPWRKFRGFLLKSVWETTGNNPREGIKPEMPKCKWWKPKVEGNK